MERREGADSHRVLSQGRAEHNFTTTQLPNLDNWALRSCDVVGIYQWKRVPICIVRAEPGRPTWYSDSSSPPMPVVAAQFVRLNTLKISRLNS